MYKIIYNIYSVVNTQKIIASETYKNKDGTILYYNTFKEVSVEVDKLNNIVSATTHIIIKKL